MRAAPAVAALADDPQQFRNAVQYIEKIDQRAPVRCPEFPRASDWINSRPLSLGKELSGKVVLLDFFTYCCINCQHVLPKLRQLEVKYGQDGSGGLVVVGVHSAKFSAERETKNIAAAVERYDVRHPVINDERMELWNALGVSSWPTLVLLGPKGNVLAVWSGERQEDDIDLVISAALEYYSDAVDHRPLPVAPARNASLRRYDEKLRYPSKVAVGASQGVLYVSDTANNRIVQLDSASGKVVRVFGNGEQGLADSRQGSEARFHGPQGIVEWNGTLFVADTENHAVRAINLDSGSVETIGGTGEQGFDYSGGKVGTKQLLSSPWDVEVANGMLYVAMAGTHQLWSLKLPGKGSRAFSEPWEVFSGTGRELEKNSAAGRLAAWAQPSHLSFARDGMMFVADSESSSVRAIDTNDGSHPTRTLAGGDGLLAENLFAFGDRDGKGARARFQHPLAVCVDDNRKLLYVADSYNHRIKVIDESGEATVYCGSGSPGLRDGSAKDAMFWEPGGLALSADGSKLYVADTNNFAVRVVDTNTRKVSTLEIASTLPDVTESGADKPLIPNRRRAVRIPCGPIKPTGRANFAVLLPNKSHFTPGTISRFQVNLTGASTSDGAQGVPKVVCLGKGETMTKGQESLFDVDLSAYSERIGGADQIEIETVTYYCTEEDDVCRTEADIFLLQLQQGADDPGRISHKIMPKKVKTTVV